MSNYFSRKELNCRCGNETCTTTVLDSVVARLNKARSTCSFGWVITSGGRCLEYNRSVGSKDTSSHIKGLAVDIKFHSSYEKFMIIKALMDEGFTRIGINDVLSFIHVDMDATKVQNVLFKY